ncbi:TrmH family RNA methyltransferase [Lactococcus allomyrinae]|uniref:RNA methyltransferase n=1 Tax=Lactococcus allomyrinae TaxID=2419773 RepID=A0A387BBH1_9LACT|nr:RNA methyltransferase [Lactococcus allomyrinae]AYF99683.1 RNA methyltransferase [Lactococcus allomyrinae]
MEIITSKDNKKVKEARKLLTKKYRKNSYLIEGFHLFEEAVKAGTEILQIFVEEGKFDKLSPVLTENLSVDMVSREVLKSLADSESPQGIIAEVKKCETEIDFSGSKYLVLENVQDPGNVGTMVRTADAAGFSGVILSENTADIYSAKVMRSMQGSNFHFPVVQMESSLLFGQLKKAGLSVLTTTLSANSVPYQSVKVHRFALVMGNEGAGVSDFAAEQADVLVHIEMPGQAESLNVAVAAGILMFSL